MHSSSPDFNEDFASEFEKTKKALESLNFDVQQKKTFLAQNKSPASLDAAIKEKIRKLEYTLKNFGDTLKEWEGAPELYSLTLREVERRRNKLSELKNLLQEIKVKASSENEGASLTKEREKLFADGSNEGNSKKFTAAETIANQKIALKKQDEQIGNLLGNVQTIKGIGINIGNELNEQNVVLDDLNKNVDRNVVQMEKTSMKFTRILENSSTWKLFLIIGIEIAILIVIIIFA